MWTKQWPTEPGWYWFYGHTRNDPEDCLIAVRVSKIQNGLMCVGSGMFIYEVAWEGVWQPITIPELPAEDVPYWGVDKEEEKQQNLVIGGGGHKRGYNIRHE